MLPAKPTMQDVADKAGVSRSLVSLVFQGSTNVSDSRRAAVMAAAQELGYRPNRLARHLAQGRSMTIGVVVDDLQNPYFTRVLDTVEQRLASAHYQILLANGARDADRTMRASTRLAELQVDGLILVGPRGSDAQVLDMVGLVPTVIVARDLVSEGRYDSVRVDEQLGSRLVVEHLAGLGHRSIVHLDGGAGASASERRTGYKLAMQSVGLADSIEVLPGEFTYDAGAKLAVALTTRAEMPTAVFAANDLIATGLWIQLERSGRTIPHDLSLVGFDDTSFPGFGGPGLTTIRQPVEIIGDRAAELLLDRLDDTERAGVHEAFPPTLIERSSTARLQPETIPTEFAN